MPPTPIPQLDGSEMPDAADEAPEEEDSDEESAPFDLKFNECKQYSTGDSKFKIPKSFLKIQLPKPPPK